MGPQTDRPSSASGLQARLWCRFSQERSRGRSLQLFKRLHNTIFGGDLFLKRTVAAVVMAVVVVVKLKDSNHIPALCLLQLKACMLNVRWEEQQNGNENAGKNHIPLHVKGSARYVSLMIPCKRWNKTIPCNVIMPVAVENLLRPRQPCMHKQSCTY